MLIDVLTVLALVPEFRGLRAMRLMRLLRNAKLFRHSNYLRQLGVHLRTISWSHAGIKPTRDRGLLGVLPSSC